MCYCKKRPNCYSSYTLTGLQASLRGKCKLIADAVVDWLKEEDVCRSHLHLDIYTIMPSPLFSIFFFFYLFLNFDFLVVSAAGGRRGCSREASELGGVAAFFIQAGWRPTEGIVLLEVSLDNEHVLALIADVTPFKLQDLHQTGTYDSASNRQEVTHIPGFRNVLSGQLWANGQTCWMRICAA